MTGVQTCALPISPNRTAIRPRNEDSIDDRNETEPRPVSPRTSGAIEKLDRIERALSENSKKSDSSPLFVAAGRRSSNTAATVARSSGWRPSSTTVAAAENDKTPLLLPAATVASTR